MKYFRKHLNLKLRAEMSDVEKRIKVVCKEYETSLEDLTFNSRVLIQSLTRLADESKVYAPYIVRWRRESPRYSRREKYLNFMTIPKRTREDISQSIAI